LFYYKYDSMGGNTVNVCHEAACPEG